MRGGFFVARETLTKGFSVSLAVNVYGIVFGWSGYS
jgi:hypothetical protein